MLFLNFGNSQTQFIKKVQRAPYKLGIVATWPSEVLLALDHWHQQEKSICMALLGQEEWLELT
jgi:hypothetical protein